MSSTRQTIVIVIFLYDTILTFDHEVVYIWAAVRTRSGASLLFFANKWLSMILYVMGLIYLAIHASDKVRCLIVLFLLWR